MWIGAAVGTAVGGSVGDTVGKVVNRLQSPHVPGHNTRRVGVQHGNKVDAPTIVVGRHCRVSESNRLDPKTAIVQLGKSCVPKHP
jgi:hypothetical protein